MKDNILTEAAGKVRYYTHFVENLMHIHPHKTTEKNIILKKRFTLEKEHIIKWYELFDVKDSNLYIPFLYFLKSSNSAIFFFDLLNHYNFKLTNIYHVYTSIKRHCEFTMQPGKEYELDAKCISLKKIAKDKIAIVIDAVLLDDQGRLLLSTDNVFMDVKLTEAEFNAIYDESTGLCEAECGINTDRWTRLPGRKPKLTLDHADEVYPVFIKNHFGQEYGKVSGDYNPLHTNRLVSYLAGHKQPFIQGLATLNNVIKVLTEKKVPWEDIQLTFCNKALETHTLFLLKEDTHIELLDGHHIVAFGEVR